MHVSLRCSGGGGGGWASGAGAVFSPYTRRLDANARLIYGHRSAPPACMCATNGEFFMRFGGAASAVVARGRPRAPYQLKVILVSLSFGRGPFRKKLSPVQYCSLTDCRLAGWMGVFCMFSFEFAIPLAHK